ncbi:prephenate dehydratase [Bacillus sp. OxB-1]|uniref:prephenate dehydratase n=1 Tax=Bacillus sp. (strain OxB-1) TaxID=98228 RepID=UPI000B1B4129|nr:prephenate dehydratase [Bacillus sp. OxB-1]
MLLKEKGEQGEMTKKERRIGYLGPVGTFTGLAVHALFPDEEMTNLHAFPTIENCLLAAHQRKTDVTVVPIENSIGGSVSMTLDWLIHEVEVPIQAEVRLPVHHELLAHPAQVEQTEFEIVYAHPQALKQCDQYLRRHYPDIEQRPMNSSAEAAWLVANNPDKPWLSISNFIAKEIYQLEAIQNNIENNGMNMTRFIALGYEELDLRADFQKSSMIVSFPENELMTLHQVLGLVDKYAIRPTKIESAPMKTELGHYVFFIDLDTTGKSDAYQQLCQDIRNLGCSLRHLGTYPTLVADIAYGGDR